VIERNCHARGDLIADLLYVSRIAAGKLRLDRAPVDLRGIAETAIGGHRAAAQAKGISLEAGLGPTGAMVCGDAGRLVQVFSNLERNALPSPQANRMLLAARRPGGDRRDDAGRAPARPSHAHPEAHPDMVAELRRHAATVTAPAR
jgi:K+-sensing histidine kinase KdpD